MTCTPLLLLAVAAAPSIALGLCLGLVIPRLVRVGPRSIVDRVAVSRHPPSAG